MDLITSAVVAAIGHGAPGHAPEAVASHYERLKQAIAKFDSAAAILAAIAALEAEPANTQLQLALSAALSAAKVPDDMETLFAAQGLLDALRPPVALPPAAPAAQTAPAPADKSAVVSNYAVVKVYFATDRQRDVGKPPAQRFSGERNILGGNGPLSYGSCDISIPRDHRMGQLESPSLWRLEFRDDPAKHVVLLSAEVQDRDNFFAALKTQIRASADKSAFLFVHGYNVSFEDAARRTGQMAYDLGFDGAPVFYSWPSRGGVAGYTIDENNIEWSTPHITAFLADFLASTEAAQVYLVGHSMGSRGLARAVADLLAAQPQLAQKITEIILSAPDIDAAIFKHDIAPKLAGARNPVTLYASSQDLALAASKAVHGYARAGDSGAGMLIVAGVETIDATGVDTSFMKHTYFAEKRSALSDMFYLIRNHARADQRFLDPVDTVAGRYWTFKP
ncbi:MULTISPECIES: alpha/beta hydrolase [unclassified Janthinobacterium]|uniref:alpha/beta hydrolase n=1 Tax=unclassified Janthinobacterium TaxID=2610881 RepID=UPI001E65467A|nr:MULTISPECIES: alpha/beta hydrolase [unclassified Janthinobacterium]MCC7641902.1 alpha/beta fold hydrolase [Janthinobacterium sp. EB271-G4-3-1]MCC7690028.1 alpha/beta fold hydrolase [Janthinobacterium sp. EB271-G4-3-2]